MRKHCEFVAVHKRTKTKVYVEVKSRRRPGVLNELGTFDASTDVRGDVFGLYSDAVRQAPADSEPYLIFIDANLPSDVPKNAPAYGAIPIETYLLLASWSGPLWRFNLAHPQGR